MLLRAASVVGVALLAASALPARGSLIAYDSVDGTLGAINGLNSGTGWGSNAWSAQNVAYYAVSNANPLVFTKNSQTLLSTPDYLTGGGAYTSAGRSFYYGNWYGDPGAFPDAYYHYTYNSNNQITAKSLGGDGTTLYLSALARPDSNPANAGNTSYKFDLANGNNVAWAANAPNVYVERAANGNWQIRYHPASGSDVTAGTGVAFVKDQTFLMVLQLDFAATGDTATLYVDPTPGMSTPDVTGAAVAMTGFTFTNLNFNPGHAVGDGDLDELRIGTTYADVVPTAVPEPAALSLLALGGVALLGRRRR